MGFLTACDPRKGGRSILEEAVRLLELVVVPSELDGGGYTLTHGSLRAHPESFRSAFKGMVSLCITSYYQALIFCYFLYSLKRQVGVYRRLIDFLYFFADTSPGILKAKFQYADLSSLCCSAPRCGYPSCPTRAAIYRYVNPTATLSGRYGTN
jgi:hypothetical protein